MPLFMDPQHSNQGLQFGGVPNLGGADFGYGQAYQNAANLAGQQYAQVMSGYNNLLGYLDEQQQGIKDQYSGLEQRALGQVTGMEESHRRDLADRYAQQSASASANLANAGLGNWTVGAGVQGGIAADREKQEAALTAALGGLKSDIVRDIGSRQLGYAGEALGYLGGVAQGQLGFAGTYPLQAMAAMPDAYQYAQLMEQRRVRDRAYRDERAAAQQLPYILWSGNVGRWYQPGKGLV